MLFPKPVSRMPASTVVSAVFTLCLCLAAALGAPRVASAAVNVSSVTLNESAAAPGETVSGTVTLSSPPAGDFIVDLSDSDNDLTFNSGIDTITVAAGSTQGTFTATFTGTAARPTNDTIAADPDAGGGSGASVALTLLPYRITEVTLSPVTAVSGLSVTGTVTVSAASSRNTTIHLSAVVLVNGQQDTAAALPISLPATVTLPAGNTTSQSFSISVNEVSSSSEVKITAAQNSPSTGTSVDSASADLYVEPPQLTSVSLPTSLDEEGAGVTAGYGTVTLQGIPPSGGIIVSLSTLYTSQISIPSSVTVNGGEDTATFPITAYASGSPATVSITATYDGVSQTGSTTLTPVGTPTLSLTPTTLGPGASATGTVTIATAAAPGGLPVSLTSSNSALTVPASVTIPGGQTSTTFTATANSVAASTPTTVTAAVNGGGSATASLTVTPPTVASVAVSPASLIGGAPATVTVTLSAPAPIGTGGLTGGMTVYLQSSSSAAPVPASGSLSIAAGQTSASFPVNTTPVAASTAVTLSASTDASFATGTQTTALTVTPPTVSSLTLSPSAVFGGNSSTGMVTLSGAAPTGGMTVYLQSSNTASATVGTSILVAAGATTATFPISTSAAAATATISASTLSSFPASPAGVTQTANLTVSTANLLLSVSPTSVSLGTSATGTVTLSNAAPTGGLVIYLQSSNSAAVVPVSVTVAGGATTATFPVTTQAVTSNATVTLSASASSNFPSGGTQTASLSVVASGVGLALSASSITAGTPVTGTVTLSGAAPAGGQAVTLTSSSSSATVPASVTVAAGATTATFTVSTYSAASVTITASASGASSSQSLTVTANSGYAYPAGWNLLSLPYDYPTQTVAQIFGAGINLFRWSPGSSDPGYIETTSSAVDAVHPGLGYWADFPQAAQITAVGTPTDTTQPYSVGLLAGWNMIGDPFTSSVSVSNLTVTVNTSTYTYANAGKLVLALYGYTPGSGGATGSYTLLNSGSTLVSGQGYWIYAVQGMTLTFPAPSAVVVPPPPAP